MLSQAVPTTSYESPEEKHPFHPKHSGVSFLSESMAAILAATPMISDGERGTQTNSPSAI